MRMTEQQMREYEPERPREMSWSLTMKLVVLATLLGFVFVLILVCLPTLQEAGPLLGHVATGVLIFVMIATPIMAVVWLLNEARIRELNSRTFNSNKWNVFPRLLNKKQDGFITPEDGELPHPELPQHYAPALHQHNEGELIKLLREVLRQKPEQLALPIPKPQVPTGRDLLLDGKVEQALTDGCIILGMQEDGQLARLKIKRCFSTLVSGLPSVGKSTTVFWITCQLVLIGAKLWIIDPHKHFQDEDGNKSLAAELADLAESFVFPPCDDDVQQVVYRLRFMYQELRKRQKPGYIVRAQDTIIGIMDEFNSIADSIDPSLVVVRHEGRELNFAQTLALLEREGRKYGLHFMLIGHKWAQQDIGGENAVRTNATTYLCHKMNDQRQAEQLLGSGYGKKILELAVGEYWITGPSWNNAPARIITPMISARDLPVLRQVKQRGIQVQKPGNVVESIVTTERADDVSTVISALYPQTTPTGTGGYNTGPRVEPVDITSEEIALSPELQQKMHLVLDMDMHHKSQNEIITDVWGCDPNTRQGRAATEELRQIRAYLASLHRKHLQRNPDRSGNGGIAQNRERRGQNGLLFVEDEERHTQTNEGPYKAL